MVLENVKAENAELLKNSGASHAIDIEMSEETYRQEPTTQIVEDRGPSCAVIQSNQEYHSALLQLQEDLERARIAIQERDSYLLEAQAAVQENYMLKNRLSEFEQKWTMESEAMKLECEALTQTNEKLTDDLQSSGEIADILGAQILDLKDSVEEERNQHAIHRELIASLENNINELNSICQGYDV
ncbi:hypothetical protein BX666DRAFT_1612927 [Dichotomocladium elegans]|nr:hypothetical protein BX666DRAFT_1612927 [Dichotomocladium elegans]